MYSYDRTAASRVTLGRFPRVDGDGGAADILLDGVYMGYIERQVESDWAGMQRKYTVSSYTAQLTGPILNAPGADALDDKEFKDLPELKRLLTSFLGKFPEGVSEAYRLYFQKKIKQEEWQERVLALI